VMDKKVFCADWNNFPKFEKMCFRQKNNDTHFCKI
jgi:hypothetical protein